MCIMCQCITRIECPHNDGRKIIESEDTACRLLQVVNQVWSQCTLKFIVLGWGLIYRCRIFYRKISVCRIGLGNKSKLKQ